MESEDVNKDIVIWKVCTVILEINFKFKKSSRNFPEIKISGNFRKDWNKFPEISGNFPKEISGLTTQPGRLGRENKKLSYCWETVRRESIPRIAEMDVEMTT